MRPHYIFNDKAVDPSRKRKACLETTKISLVAVPALEASTQRPHQKPRTQCIVATLSSFSCCRHQSNRTGARPLLRAPSEAPIHRTGCQSAPLFHFFRRNGNRTKQNPSQMPTTTNNSIIRKARPNRKPRLGSQQGVCKYCIWEQPSCSWRVQIV